MSMQFPLPDGATVATAAWTVFGMPFEFLLFACTLIGVLVAQRYALQVAVGGMVGLVTYKLVWAGFGGVAGIPGLRVHLAGEWSTLANLFCLLTGFALLARHFECARVIDRLPCVLPRNWHGGFMLLAFVFAVSSFLDNIAAALIGGAVARQVFGGRVHVGYLAAIVAASNAGGSGSVVGDTTTTMMWIEGKGPLQILPAYLAASVALVVTGLVAARQQQAYSPILRNAHDHTRIDWLRMGIVALILVSAIAANLFANLGGASAAVPWIGLAVWAAILVTVPLRRPDWELLPDAVRGSVFLLSLVLMASMMPVEALPPASWTTAFALGFVSSVFDNIPLTALALRQGGYDWGFLAYCVGFGGSMLWFGSSAGVALSNLFPEARSAVQWVRHGWHVTLAYVVGAVVMGLVWGWHPAP